MTKPASLDQAIDTFFQPISDAIAGFIFYSMPVMGAQVPLIVCWLVLGACFFTRRHPKIAP